MTLPEGPRASRLIQIARWLRTPTVFFREMDREYGDIFTMTLPALGPIVVTSSPEGIRQIFTAAPDEMHAGKANAVLRPLLGERSLLLLDGDEHLRERKLMLPPFHGERMRAYGSAMLEFAEQAIAGWSLNEVFPLHGSMQEVTLRVIVRTIFGIRETAAMERMCQQLSHMTDTAASPMLLFPFMQHDLGAWSPWGKVVRRKEQVRRLLQHEINQRRAGHAPARDDVLSLLLDARDEDNQPMPDTALFHELVTLLVAGHETTATSLAWAIRWLMEDEALVRTLTEQVRDSMENGVLRADRVARLELLDGVVRETLRLQPVVPIVARVLQKPTTLLGYDLPAGSRVAASIWLAHRRSSVWPEPEKFDPSRFIGHKPSAYEWLPFGGGIRRCIGAEFALYEMKMVLAAILAHCDLRLAPGPRSRIQRRAVTFAPHDGVRVVLHRRGTIPSRTAA